MPVYDTTFILNPQLEESGLDSRLQEYINLIGNNGGKMVKENRIGMRRMAYEIANLHQGYYISLVFEGSSDLVTELERRLRIDEGCIRFLTCLYRDFGVRRKDKKKKKAKKEQPPEEPQPVKAEESSPEDNIKAATESSEDKQPEAGPDEKEKPEPRDSSEDLL